MRTARPFFSVLVASSIGLGAGSRCCFRSRWHGGLGDGAVLELADALFEGFDLGSTAIQDVDDTFESFLILAAPDGQLQSVGHRPQRQNNNPNRHALAVRGLDLRPVYLRLGTTMLRGAQQLGTDLCDPR
jgi:hypothetical protein